jgi:hypothetical protein
VARRRGVPVSGAGTPGLGGVRSDIGHHPQPRDPFAVDTGRAVDAIRAQWGDSYHVKACEGGYEAVRKRGPRVALTAETPDGLVKAMLEDSGLSC